MDSGPRVSRSRGTRSRDGRGKGSGGEDGGARLVSRRLKTYLENRAKRRLGLNPNVVVYVAFMPEDGGVGTGVPVVGSEPLMHAEAALRCALPGRLEGLTEESLRDVTLQVLLAAIRNRY